jgi:hypothetical protein
MKMRLDTTKKTIKIDENVKLENFIKTLEKLLPEELWKEYTLEANTAIQNWQNPIIVEPYCPKNPVYYPIYCGGTYKVEC